MNEPVTERSSSIPAIRAIGRRFHWLEAVALLSILTLALALRLMFRTGIVFQDDLGYAQAAHDLTKGIFRLAPWPGGLARVGLYFPVAALYAVFGVNDATTLAWPLFCSLLNVVFIHAIGRLLAGEAAGLLSAFLWAIFPLDIQMATALLPDAPLAAFTAGSVLFLLLGERAEGRHAWMLYSGSLFCLAEAMLIKPLAFLVPIFGVAYLIWKHPPRRTLIFVVVAILVASGLFLYYQYASRARPSLQVTDETVRQQQISGLETLSGTATDWFRKLMQQPEFLPFTPLFIVAFAVSLSKRRREAAILVLWGGVTFLYFELGSQSPLRYEPISANLMTRQILLVMVPFVTLAGIYVAEILSVTQARWLVMGLSVLIEGVAWAGSRGMPAWSWGATGQSMDTLPFATLSAICVAVAIFGGISSPLFAIGQPAVWKTVGATLLLAGVGLAALNPIYRLVTENRIPWQKTSREALALLKAQPEYLILVQNAVFGARLNYAAGFQLGFDYFAPQTVTSQTRLRIAPDDPKQISAAYVLVDEYHLAASEIAGWGVGPSYLKSPPATWWKVAEIGDIPGYRLKIYRVSTEDAARELQAAYDAVRTLPNADNLHRLMASAVNAGDFCSAAGAWQGLRGLEPEAVRTIDLIPILSGCYAARPDIAGPNVVQNGDFGQGLKGWYQEATWKAKIELGLDTDGATPVLKVTSDGTEDWRVLLQELNLQPGTAYVYETMIKSTAPVVTLYRELDRGEYLRDGQVYPEWTLVRDVFIAPGPEGQPRRALIYPFLLRGAGQVWIKQVRLSPLEFEKVRVP